jgi:hypothetical protein
MQFHGSRFSLTQRSSANRQGSSSLPGVSPLQNAQIGGYHALLAAKVAGHRGNPGLDFGVSISFCGCFGVCVDRLSRPAVGPFAEREVIL